MVLELKHAVLLIAAALLSFSCEPAVEDDDSQQTPPALEDDEQDVEEVDDPSLMTLANFENSFLTFNEKGGDLEYSIVTNPRKRGVNTSRRCGLVESGGGAWEFIWS